MAEAEERLSNVRDYYGRVLGSSRDLKSSACCSADHMPGYLREAMRRIDPEILEKFYGCGSPIPPALEGCTVLDLGCGTGRDVYLASRLVGAEGRVIGVDMTEEQLRVARRHVESQAEAFGLDEPNVEFRRGYIEEMEQIGLEDDSVDVVISNCVINLSPDKRRVFSEIFRVLRPGGELYFADIFAGRRVPEKLRRHPVLVGECLGGALYIEDFRRMLEGLGCPDYRVVESRGVSLDDAEVERLAGMIDFYSMTIRAFNLPELEDACEDYGQLATYRGTVPHYPHRFALDEDHVFERGRPVRVCGNTAMMLQRSRYAPHFEVQGDRSAHYGRFRVAGPSPTSREEGPGCCG